MIARTVQVSDHALLRYLERVKGIRPSTMMGTDDREILRRLSYAIDITAARAEIADICGVAAALGAPTKAHDGHIYIIDNYVVVTVLPKGGAARARSYPPGTRGRYAVKAAASS